MKVRRKKSPSTSTGLYGRRVRSTTILVSWSSATTPPTIPTYSAILRRASSGVPASAGLPSTAVSVIHSALVHARERDDGGDPVQVHLAVGFVPGIVGGRSRLQLHRQRLGLDQAAEEPQRLAQVRVVAEHAQADAVAHLEARVLPQLLDPVD